MASSSAVHSVFQPRFIHPRALALNHSEFISSKSLCRLRSKIQLAKLRNVPRRHRFAPMTVALQSNIFRALQTALKVGRDGIDAATNLVPDSIPRPIARLGVTSAAVTVSLFVLRSFLSTVFFALGTMGFIYFVYLALNKDKAPDIKARDPKSTDEAIEEARRIMDKYK